jgi:hypothetical protein
MKEVDADVHKTALANVAQSLETTSTAEGGPL